METYPPDDDASKVSSLKPPSVADEEAALPQADESTPKKRGRKRTGDEMEEKEVKLKKKRAQQTASIPERPSRERKSVERYAALSPRKISATKALKIPQGPGEMLKDIPNVVFRLSKRKADESLRVLHTILFGRKANAHSLKRNILQFSGFVWSQNEYKDRSKVMEKLNKCYKDRLLEFCDLLDVYSLKTTTKKEEISVKLMEFLESPHATRDVMLSEKNKKGKKRRRGAKRTLEKALREASSEKKRQKSDLKAQAKKGCSKTAEADQDPGKGGSIGTDDESLDEDKNGNAFYEDRNDNAEENSEHSDKSEARDDENEHDEPQSAKKLLDGEMLDHEEPESKVKSPVVKKVYRVQSRKGPASFRKKADIDDDAKVSSKKETVFSMENKGNSKKRKEKTAGEKDSKDNAKGKAFQKNGKAGSGPGSSKISEKGYKKKGKKNIETAIEDAKGSKKQVAKMVSKDAGKKQGKHKDDSAGPSKEQLYAVVVDILREVDFNVATLADIIRQLGAHFNADLMHRKAEIKCILEEVINNMTDDDDAEDEGSDAGAQVGGKD